MELKPPQLQRLLNCIHVYGHNATDEHYDKGHYSRVS